MAGLTALESAGCWSGLRCTVLASVGRSEGHAAVTLLLLSLISGNLRDNSFGFSNIIAHISLEAVPWVRFHRLQSSLYRLVITGSDDTLGKKA